MIIFFCFLVQSKYRATLICIKNENDLLLELIPQRCTYTPKSPRNVSHWRYERIIKHVQSCHSINYLNIKLSFLSIHLFLTILLFIHSFDHQLFSIQCNVNRHTTKFKISRLHSLQIVYFSSQAVVFLTQSNPCGLSSPGFRFKAKSLGYHMQIFNELEAIHTHSEVMFERHHVKKQNNFPQQKSDSIQIVFSEKNTS